ncbi:MAG: right-handed parallel beta-helix repeat-containing protein [Ginsengibacter sp.]
MRLFSITVLFLLYHTGVMAQNEIAPGPHTARFNANEYENILYVSATVEGVQDGSLRHPYSSIKKAVDKTTAMVGSKAIVVSEGIYKEDKIQLPTGTSLYGGFHFPDMERDIEKYPSQVQPSQNDRIFIPENQTVIDGFIIRDAAYRGKGGAIFCGGTSPVITNNIFINNKTLNPLNWAPKYMHRTANDGGTIYAENNAAPVISHNLFTKNSTENGRGAGVACANHCKPQINYNVFLENTTGTNDPMRSSDGGAISIFNWCDATIEGNYFLSNTALSKNDGGAVFVALWSSAKIYDNLFIHSKSGDDAGSLFVGGQEHRYDAPLDELPSASKFFVDIKENIFFGNSNSSANSGVMRFTMESRGAFNNNITAFNTGVYFQRSEVEVKNNVIMDNFLFIETKKGLKESTIANNLISGSFSLQTPAIVKNNFFEGAKAFQKDLQLIPPRIVQDGISTHPYAASYNKDTYKTRIIVEGVSVKDLVGRTIVSNDKWGIVDRQQGNILTVWGDLNGAVEVFILPTYTLTKK